MRNASDSVELPAPSAFASCSQLLNYPLKLSFHDEVPTSNQFISPAHFAQLSHANTTTDFSQLGGSADQLQYLLSNSFVSLSLLPSDNDSQPLDLDQVPAHIAKTLKSDIHHERFELLSSAKTTEHFRSLGGTQRELQFLLTKGHLTLNAHPSMYAAEVRAMTSDLRQSPKHPNHVPPVPLLIDNCAALSVANHPRTTPRSKHISLREFRIRDYQGDTGHPQSIICLWTPTKLNVSDIFTKLLGSVDFPRLARFLVNCPFNAIADQSSAHLGVHHPSSLPRLYHSSWRSACLLDPDQVVLPFTLPVPDAPNSFRAHVSSAQGGEENSTLALAISAAPPGSDLVTVEDTPESVSLFSYKTN